MSYSRFDPAMKERAAWNGGKTVAGYCDRRRTRRRKLWVAALEPALKKVSEKL